METLLDFYIPAQIADKLWIFAIAAGSLSYAGWKRWKQR